MRYWDLGRYTRQNRPTLPRWILTLCRYAIICHSCSRIKQSCHFERDFDRALLQLADTLNSQFKYLECSWYVHYIIITETFEVFTKKVMQSLLCYYWIFRTRLHVHLRKWTPKFNLLCLLNQICYFNNNIAVWYWIRCKICEKSTTIPEI